MAMSRRDHLARWRHRAERVRDLGERDDARARPKQLFVFIEQNVAPIVDGRDAELRPCFEAKLLPGNDVGVMFEPGDDDLVARLHIAASP